MPPDVARPAQASARALPRGADTRARRGPLATLARRELWLIGFLLAHVPLALALRLVPGLSTLHALGTLGVGLVVATTSRQPARAAQVLFYLAGAEVLWRMTRAGVVWEYGKYATVLILLVAGLRLRPRRNAGAALIYFALLVPSIPLTFMDQPFGQARMYVSFNMSGPLALALTCWFAARLTLTREQLDEALVAFLAPAVGIASAAFLGIAAAGRINWVAESNAVTSGGFGPNQVSSIMGLGILAAFLLFNSSASPKRLRWLMFGMIVFLGVQSALTFSRSGLYLAGASSLAAGIFLLGPRQRRFQLVLGLLALVMLGRYVLAPRLDSFTEGKLSERFSERDVTGRDRILGSDLQIFFENPILGIGPGMGAIYRDERGKRVAPHTEYVRLLSEHGILGAVALVLLLVMASTAMRARRLSWERAATAGLLAWALLFMLSNGMRVVAPSLLFGFACFVTFVPSRPDGTGPPAPQPAAPARAGGPPR